MRIQSAPRSVAGELSGETMKPVEVRFELAHVLKLDPVGPEDGLGSPDEVLSQAPSRWYLTGFLVPLDAEDSHTAIDVHRKAELVKFWGVLHLGRRIHRLTDIREFLSVLSPDEVKPI